MTPAEYHTYDAISQSAIKALLKCPEYYRRKFIAKDFDEDSKALEFGSAVDCYVTDPAEFAERYAEVQRRTGATGKIELTPAVYKDVVTTAEFVTKQPIFQKITKDLDRQVPMIVDFEGMKLKALPDFFGKVHTKKRDLFRIVDLKTARDAEWNTFKWAIQNYGYLFQLAWYKVLARLVTADETTPFEFYLAVVDDKCFRMYKVEDDLIDDQVLKIVELLKEKPWETRLMQDQNGHVCPLKFECPYALQDMSIPISKDTFNNVTT